MGVWQDIWNVVLSEFSDIPHAVEAARITLRILIASILGGLLGFEREARGKAAGLRTHMLVALGAAIFVLVPQQAGASGADLSRVLQGLVAGVGFLGAGSIIMGQKKDVAGLTTAAIGAAAGMGREATAVLSTILALAILSLIPMIARLVGYSKRKSETMSE